jgi:hypothetical protein
MQRPFIFEKFWLSHPDFMKMVKDWWTNIWITGSSKMYVLQQKLKQLKHNLKKWNKSTFGNIFIAKTIMDQEMEQLQL